MTDIILDSTNAPALAKAPIRIALEDVTPTIAAAFGDDLCLIWSGEWQSYWRAGGNGYTKDIAQAGWYTIQAAYARTRHCDPSKQIAFERPDATPARGGDELREAVRAVLSFTSHAIGCAIYQRSWASGEPDCSCGLDAARKALASTDMAGALVRDNRSDIAHIRGDLIAAPQVEGLTSEPRDDYRGWQIEHNPPPIPCRDFDFTATHPGFDGEGDTRQVWGASWDAVRAEIDDWHEEHSA